MRKREKRMRLYISQEYKEVRVTSTSCIEGCIYEIKI